MHSAPLRCGCGGVGFGDPEGPSKHNGQHPADLPKFNTQYLLYVLHHAIGDPNDLPAGCGLLIWRTFQALRPALEVYDMYADAWALIIKFVTVPRSEQEHKRLNAHLLNCQCAKGPSALRDVPTYFHSLDGLVSLPNASTTLASMMSSLAFMLHQMPDKFYDSTSRERRARRLGKQMVFPQHASDILPFGVLNSIPPLVNTILRITHEFRQPFLSGKPGLFLTSLVQMCRARTISGLLISPPLLIATLSFADRQLDGMDCLKPSLLSWWLDEYMAETESALTVLKDIVLECTEHELLFMCNRTNNLGDILQLCDKILRYTDPEWLTDIGALKPEQMPRLSQIRAPIGDIGALILFSSRRFHENPDMFHPSLHAGLCDIAQKDNNRQKDFAWGIELDRLATDRAQQQQKTRSAMFFALWYLSDEQRCGSPSCIQTRHELGRRFQRCSQCQLVQYCSKSCQRTAWRHPAVPHKDVCHAFEHFKGKWPMIRLGDGKIRVLQTTIHAKRPFKMENFRNECLLVAEYVRKLQKEKFATLYQQLELDRLEIVDDTCVASLLNLPLKR